jgi:prepilin signal peptidase PulO-like enzyme (type II secretory pathway)
MMVSLIFIDMEHMILPDAITYPLLGLALLVRIIYPIFFGAEYFTDLKAAPLSTFQNFPGWLSTTAGAVVGAATGLVILSIINDLSARFHETAEDEDSETQIETPANRGLQIGLGVTGAVIGAALLTFVKAPPVWLVSLYGAILGALLGGGFLWLIGEVWKRLRGVDAMGFGDVKMMYAVGALLGWKLTALSLFLGAFSGAIIGMIVVSRQKEKDMQTQIPFGIFLGIGSIVALLFGDQIIGWYIRTFIPG